MKEKITKILLQYPIQAEEIMTLKNNRIWRIQGKDATYILKALSFPKKECSFIFGAMSQLEKNGFTAFNQLLPTKHGNCYTAFENRYWFLTREIAGKEADFTKNSQLSLLGSYLADFHCHSIDYFPKAPYEGRLKWQKWGTMAAAKKEELFDFKKENKKDTYFDIAFCRYLEYFLEDLEKALPVFCDKEFLKLCKEEQEKGSFCHHDLAHHNFLKDGKEFYLIDFDYLLGDIRCHDVANILGKILKANHWEIQKAFCFLQAYEGIRPLSAGERQGIAAMLRFPQDYWQCAFARYRELDFSHRNEKKLKHWLKERTLRRNALTTLEENFREVSL